MECLQRFYFFFFCSPKLGHTCIGLGLFFRPSVRNTFFAAEKLKNRLREILEIIYTGMIIL